MRRRAFTLIEILVVIAIILILASILFPVFARAKLSAKQTTCISNLHQMALANSIEDGRPKPNLECPLKAQYPNLGYEHIPLQALKGLEDADPNHGVTVCPLHGEPWLETKIMSASAFKGKLIRARRDGSAKVVSVPKYCWTLNGRSYVGRPQWVLWTDAPCPPEHCGTDLRECP